MRINLLAIVAALTIASPALANDLLTATTTVGIAPVATATLTDAEKAEVGVMVFADCIRLSADGNGVIIARNAEGQLRVFTNHPCATIGDPLLAAAEEWGDEALSRAEEAEAMAAAAEEALVAALAEADAAMARATAAESAAEMAQGALAQCAAHKTELETALSRTLLDRVDPALCEATPKARPKLQVVKVEPKKHVPHVPARKPMVDDDCNCTITLKEGDHFVDID